MRLSYKKNKTGFSLIEILVVMGIVGVLIALLVPVLAKARSKALDTVTRANLRTSHTAFTTYTSAYKDTYPWRPQNGPLIPLNPQQTMGASIPHFQISSYWPGLMHQVMPWEEHYASWLGGGARHGEKPWNDEDEGPLSFRPPSFHLSDSFLARPRLWTPGETDTERNLRPVREQDVLAPANKVLLYDAEKSHLRNDPEADRDPTLMLFTDGHVAQHKRSEANVLTDRPWRTPTPLHDTPLGVRGRDY